MISEKVLNKFEIIPDYDSVECKEIDDETYFSSEYRNYISNSKLKLINPDEGGSFETYLKGLQSASSTSLSVGTAVHEVILQEESFEISDQLKPTAKAGMMIDRIFYYRNKKNEKGEYCYKIGESIIFASEDVGYYTNQLTKKRLRTLLESGWDYYKYLKRLQSFKPSKEQIVLDKTTRPIVLSCIEQLRRNEDAMNLLRPDAFNFMGYDIINRNEDAIFINVTVKFPNSLTDPNAEIVSQDLALKIKIDNWSIDLDNKYLTLNDLKTTGKAVYMFPGSIRNETGEFLEGSFQHYHYYRQMGMYIWVLRQYVKREFNIDLKEFTTNLNMIVVSTVPNYSTSVFRVTNEWAEKGFEEFAKLLKYAAYAEYNREKLLKE